jgi:hypothetical protein
MFVMVNDVLFQVSISKFHNLMFTPAGEVDLLGILILLAC